MIRIQVSAGKDSFTKEWDGTEPLRVGRLPTCGLPIAVTDVSREHCVFEPSNGGFKVRDLGSRNGTLLNGLRVEEGPIAAGDVVQLCPEVTLTFDVKAAAKPAPV